MMIDYMSVFASPFTVEPTEGSLGVGEYMQLNVEFKPKKVGDYKGALIVHYSTGELITLRCIVLISYHV